ncbi:MAG: carboxypeptidase regulatory-like domain-containing protein [Acidobacteriaceae bacterium]
MRRFFPGIRCSLAVILLCTLAVLPAAWAQNVTGKIDVTVVDPSGAIVSGAKLTLQDLSTNYTREAETLSSGTFSFVNLNIGKYKLTVTKPGFQPQEYGPITVSSTKATALNAKLQIGQATQSVVVEGGAAPILETTTNTIGTTIDLKQIEQLPMSGRDLTQLSRLTPGYTGGTWNGLPSIAQGNNVDGVIGSPSRMKFGGNSQSSISPRLEDIEEMTVQTDQLDMNQGFGQAAMQINYVTRRGTNAFHGRLFEDYRNSALNANSWTNNARGVPKPKLILNDFGGSIGGPIFKDKLFFFFSLANSRRPGGVTANSTYIVPDAQNGVFTYQGSDGQTYSVNLFNVVAAYNSAHGTSMPTTVNSTIGQQLSSINSAIQGGAVSESGDPIINNVSWNFPAPTIIWYPTLRLDYNTSRSVTMNFAINRTKRTDNGANFPFFPGSDFSSTGSGTQFDAFTASYGIDWTLRPTMMNQLKVGYLYNVSRFGYNTSRAYEQDPNRVNWPLGLTSPANWNVPVTSYYPLVNVSDTFSWQKGAHSFNFGFSFYREQDHYWNPPELRNVNLGIAEGDPVINALTNAGTYNPLPNANSDTQSEARDLYALLAGRISGVTGSYPYDQKSGQYIQQPALAYNLNELSKAYGLFFQDSWRMRPSFTLNYGLRWDFTGANHDLTSAYHNADEASLYGPSGVGNLFQPGNLPGTMNPVLAARPRPYQDWNVSPQPALGFSWNPQLGSGLLGKVAGQGGLVIRGGYSLRRFTVPYQYFWDNASDYGSFFYQFYSLTANNTGTTGTFSPGSLALGDTLPPYLFEPTSYQDVAPISQYTFIGGPGANGMKYKIGQPYTQSWNLGIQRKVGGNGVLEIRYNGNRTIHQWINENLNEVNVFENGFLTDFQNAQKNLAINGGSSFGNINPGAGTVPIPIITAAFTGSTTGDQTAPSFSSGTFINNLQNGSVGSFAGTLAGVGDQPYLCNLVGAGFSPCATNLGYTGAGAGFPINIFQANPYAAGLGAVGYMTDAGYSNYHGLQVDFRERAWHGMTVDANYTWSHTLGVSTPNDWTGAYPSFTLRNLRQSYGPTLYDLRHVVHVNATVDLPFGKGRAFLNQGGVLDKIIGGWNVGTIMTYQTGYPFRVIGGNRTFNDIADSGVNLNGLTPQQLQDAVGVYRVPGQSFVTLINPDLLLAPTGGANLSKITPNTTPGTIAAPIYLHGPHGFFDDIAITKDFAITERWRFTFQTEMLNAFNHPVFGQSTNPITSSVKSSRWGQGSWNDPRAGNIGGFNRQIEFRANITF